MTRTILFAAASLSLFIAGCCDQSVKVRAFFGHKSLDECLRQIDAPDLPVSLICPGSEVTVCWQAKGNKTDPTVTLSPDPGGLSGTMPSTGVLYFTPADSTVVTVTASDCATTTKQVQVVNGQTAAKFDAHFTPSCSDITYSLDPNFVDDKILALDVTAEWEPTVQLSDGGVATCPTPPFLDGQHPIEGYGFEIDRPHITVPFSRSLKAIEEWKYQLQTCGPGFKCNPFATMRFDMTLICPEP
jgi:hypothetical protein